MVGVWDSYMGYCGADLYVWVIRVLWLIRCCEWFFSETALKVL